MSLRNNSFEHWRLSRIEEELERLSYSSQDTSADDGSCSPRSAEGTLERRSGCPKGLGAGGLGKEEGIYSRAELGTQKQTTKEEENSKEAVRFMKEKYDSLGKVKVKKPSVDSQEISHVTSGEGGGECPHGLMLEGSPASVHKNVQGLVAAGLELRVQDCDEQESAAEGKSAAAATGRLASIQGTRSSLLISEQELNQVEMFYRSHKTSVFVCLCQASLYLSDSMRNSLCPVRTTDDLQQRSQTIENWTLVKSGIPVLVLDTGESRRQRRLNLILAERGTGFGLWRDQIDCLSNYDAPSVTFHTMHLSNDHSKLIGLRFEDPVSASNFLDHIRRLTSDVDDPLLCLASSGDDRKAKKAKKTEAKKQKGKSPTVTKADISQPCCFTHITKLDRSDGSNLLRDQTSAADYNARKSPRPGSGSADRHKVKLKP